MRPRPARSPARTGFALAAICFVLYNLNGRELGSYDSQPSKFLAREILLRHTFTLDATVSASPDYATRHGFVRTDDGSFRSAYSVVPAMAAAAVGAAPARLGLIDLNAPQGPSLIAKVTASLLCAVAVFFAYLTARRRASEAVAAAVALGLGLGTNVWALASQTLWQHESVLASLSLAVFCLARPRAELRAWHLWVASAGLGLAGAARPQVAPLVAVLSVSLIVRRGRRLDVLALAPALLCAGLALLTNVHWFGHLLGAVPRLEAMHPLVHDVEASFARQPWRGALGLLISPSRGLLVFSPIVLAIVPAWTLTRREGARGDLLWWWIAAAAQFCLYAAYSVWWGGNTYGPRYLIDLLPLLVPLAAVGAARLAGSPAWRTIGGLALAWSILLAATGAWCYPADGWNIRPTPVDRHHARLWDWRDPQFVRCWRRGPSPQNFAFLKAGAFTPPVVAER